LTSERAVKVRNQSCEQIVERRPRWSPTTPRRAPRRRLPASVRRFRGQTLARGTSNVLEEGVPHGSYGEDYRRRLAARLWRSARRDSPARDSFVARSAHGRCRPAQELLRVTRAWQGPRGRIAARSPSAAPQGAAFSHYVFQRIRSPPKKPMAGVGPGRTIRAFGWRDFDFASKPTTSAGTPSLRENR